MYAGVPQKLKEQNIFVNANTEWDVNFHDISASITFLEPGHRFLYSVLTIRSRNTRENKSSIWVMLQVESSMVTIFGTLTFPSLVINKLCVFKSLYIKHVIKIHSSLCSPSTMPKVLVHLISLLNVALAYLCSICGCALCSWCIPCTICLVISKSWLQSILQSTWFKYW